MSTRRRFSGDFTAKVPLEALWGAKTVQEIVTRHKTHPNRMSMWKQRAVERMKEVFSKGTERVAQGMRRRSGTRTRRSGS